MTALLCSQVQLHQKMANIPARKSNAEGADKFAVPAQGAESFENEVEEAAKLSVSHTASIYGDVDPLDAFMAENEAAAAALRRPARQTEALHPLDTSTISKMNLEIGYSTRVELGAPSSFSSAMVCRCDSTVQGLQRAELISTQSTLLCCAHVALSSISLDSGRLRAASCFRSTQQLLCGCMGLSISVLLQGLLPPCKTAIVRMGCQL